MLEIVNMHIMGVSFSVGVNEVYMYAWHNLFSIHFTHIVVTTPPILSNKIVL